MVSVLTGCMVNVQITNNVTSFASQKRFAKDLTIASLKGKLELITGCSSVSMELQLMDKDGKLVTGMNNDDAMLGSYPIEDDMRIHVIDKDPTSKAGEFEDVSKVEKFEISSEEYAKRTDSVRAFKERMKLGKFREVSPEEEEQKRQKEKQEQEEAEAIKVGSRCEVQVGGKKRGIVMFVGKTDFKPGWWIGVKYDEPLGKNNGSVAGKKYFECEPKFGGFVRVKDVKTGDFPEEVLGLDDEDEM